MPRTLFSAHSKAILLGFCLLAQYAQAATVELTPSPAQNVHELDERADPDIYGVGMPPPTPSTVYQMTNPVYVPSGSSNQYGCIRTQQLVSNTFNTWGPAFSAAYNPPNCDFSRVVLNLSVQISGQQYDRLGSIWLGDVEIMRTSSAEPGGGNVQWSYAKDVSQFSALFKQNGQRVIFDWPNGIQPPNIGALNVNLTASFFSDPTVDGHANPDVVLALSAQKSSQKSSSWFSLPSDSSDTTINSSSFPRNPTRAVATVMANGQGDEEFWWMTSPSQGTSFREIQLYIDDQLAGVVWPEPILYTGAVVGPMWINLVGLDVFDLKAHEIDVTPWLGLLTDGKAHHFRFNVVNVNDDGYGDTNVSSTIRSSNWVVSGALFLFNSSTANVPAYNSSTAVVFSKPQVSTPKAKANSSIDLHKNRFGQNVYQYYSLDVARYINISSTVSIAGSQPSTISWTQNLQFNSWQNLTDLGRQQVINLTAHGAEVASSSAYAQRYKHFIYFHRASLDTQLRSFDREDIQLGKLVDVFGPSVEPTGLDNFVNLTGTSDEFAPSNLRGGSSSATQPDRLRPRIVKPGLSLSSALNMPGPAVLGSRVGVLINTTGLINIELDPSKPVGIQWNNYSDAATSQSYVLSSYPASSNRGSYPSGETSAGSSYPSPPSLSFLSQPYVPYNLQELYGRIAGAYGWLERVDLEYVNGTQTKNFMQNNTMPSKLADAGQFAMDPFSDSRRKLLEGDEQEVHADHTRKLLARPLPKLASLVP